MKEKNNLYFYAKRSRQMLSEIQSGLNKKSNYSL